MSVIDQFLAAKHRITEEYGKPVNVILIDKRAPRGEIARRGHEMVMHPSVVDMIATEAGQKPPSWDRTPLEGFQLTGTPLKEEEGAYQRLHREEAEETISGLEDEHEPADWLLR